MLAAGDLLVEVDHDDELATNCVEVLTNNIGNGDMLYSDCVEMDDRKSPPVVHKYSEAYGWRYYPCVVNG